jgi:hypothetical protein
MDVAKKNSLPCQAQITKITPQIFAQKYSKQIENNLVILKRIARMSAREF